MADKVPHLRDLFITGRQAEIEVYDLEDTESEPLKILIWLRKPSVQHYEEATAKARAKQSRRRQLYRNTESDEYLSVMEQIAQLETKEEVIEQLVSFEENNIRSQSYNEALFGDDDKEPDPVTGEGGPRWGKEGQDYMDVLMAIRQRAEEIQTYNTALSEEDADLKIDLDKDDEMVRLNVTIQEFEVQRDELIEKAKAVETAKWTGMTRANLDKALMKKLIDLEASMVFYQEYKTMMLYFAARTQEDHHKNYFSSPDEIWDLPEYVRMRLFAEYDELEAGADNLKNSLSPQLS